MSTRKITVLVFLSALSSMISVAGLITAGKLQALTATIAVPVSMWMFPLVFVIGNIATEIYGGKVSRLVTWATFSSTFLAVLYYTGAVILPYPDYWQKQQAYQTVLLTTPRIMISSFIAYVVVALSSIWIMEGVKRLTQGRWLWLRITITAFLGMALDSVLFNFMAFYGTMPLDALWLMCVVATIVKTALQLVCIPISYGVVKFVKERITDNAVLLPT